MAIKTHDSKDNPFPRGYKIHGFKGLNQCKSDVINLLVKDQNILKLLVYNDNLPLTQSNLRLKKDDILNEYIFPSFEQHTIETESLIRNFINIDYGRIVPIDDNLNKTQLYIDIFVDKTIQMIEEGDRRLEIMHYIQLLLEDSRNNKWISKLTLQECSSLSDESLSGFRMIYVFKSFK